MPLDAISATLLTTAALMFVALIRRVRLGLWPRARRELRRHWLGGTGRSAAGPSAAWLPPLHRQALHLLRRAAPQTIVRSRISVSRLIAARSGAPDATAGQGGGRGLSVDLVVLDPISKRRLVVLLETADLSERRRKRLEQTRELLFTHGIAVSVWRELDWPIVASVRQQLSAAGLNCPASEAPRRRPPTRHFGAQTQPSTLL